ncbi:MAG: acetylornithine/succinylornithine family transaminase [bacterium]
MHHLMSTYASLPLSFTHGKGPWLYDEQDNAYLDCVSGVAVCALGHSHPKFVAAMDNQLHRLIHVSNLFTIPQQVRLGDALCARSGMDKVFFCNSGAEANETSIKLARLRGHKLGYAQPKIIVTDGSFHGRTLATLSATGNPKVQQGFEPLVEGFLRVPFNDLDAIEQLATKHDDIVAILVEPVQGEGGVNVPDTDYLSGIRSACDKHNWLMMLDEVQTGIGRTGEWFAFQHQSVTPDVMNLAKGLGNGFPIGACVAKGEAATLFAPGNHGSTFGGNPLACTAANTVLEVIEDENILDNVQRQSQRIQHSFESSIGKLEGVKEIRASGLLIGIELNKACGELVKQAIDTGILINVTANNVVRLLPPLIINDEQADTIVAKVSKLVETFLNQQD